MKSVLVDFLVGAGIKPTSIVSYNHLGNNDGMNLSAPQTFRSKEISKSNVVDDMVRQPCLRRLMHHFCCLAGGFHLWRALYVSGPAQIQSVADQQRVDSEL